MPLFQGSSTLSAKVVATIASTQSPPAASTCAPTSAARRDWAATMPPLDVTAGLRTVWAWLNWCGMMVSVCYLRLSGFVALSSAIGGSALRMGHRPHREHRKGDATWLV